MFFWEDEERNESDYISSWGNAPLAIGLRFGRLALDLSCAKKELQAH
jgi:hypothetical protein